MAAKKHNKPGIVGKPVNDLAVEIAAASGGSVTPDEVKKLLNTHGLGKKKKISIIDYIATLLSSL